MLPTGLWNRGWLRMSPFLHSDQFRPAVGVRRLDDPHRAVEFIVGRGGLVAFGIGHRNDVAVFIILAGGGVAVGVGQGADAKRLNPFAGPEATSSYADSPILSLTPATPLAYLWSHCMALVLTHHVITA